MAKIGWVMTLMLMLQLTIAPLSLCQDKKPAYSQATVQAVVNLLTEFAKYRGQGNKSKEERLILEKIISYDPSPASGLAHKELGLVCAKSNDLAGAIREFKLAVKFDPKDQDALRSLAICYQDNGNIQQAIETYTQFLTKFPNSPNSKSAKSTLLGLTTTLKPTDNPEDSDYFNSISKIIHCWPKDRLPIKVFIADGTKIRGYKPEYKTFLINAFDQWTKASNTLTWQLVPDKKSASVICAWASKPQDIGEQERGQDGSSHIMSRVYKNNNKEEPIDSASLYIFTEQQNKQGRTESQILASAKNRCLHEVGHIMGLQGHSSNPADIMYVSEGGTETVTELSDRDKVTIARLYAPMAGGNNSK